MSADVAVASLSAGLCAKQRRRGLLLLTGDGPVATAIAWSVRRLQSDFPVIVLAYGYALLRRLVASSSGDIAGAFTIEPSGPAL